MQPALSWFVAGLAGFPALAQAADNPDLSSGGLAPPPAIEAEGPPSASVTEEDLERADREDAGRGLSFFWLKGEVGYEVIGLSTFHSNDLVDAGLVPSTQNGLAFGAGAGVRLVFLTVGARFRIGTFEDWQLWTLNAEVGLHIPIGALEPYFTFGGGYASLGSFDTQRFADALGTGSGPTARGFDLRGGVGLDYFIGGTLSVGANLSGDVLFLSRSKVSGVTAGGTGGENDAAAQVYAQDGSSIGGAATLMAVVGLHF